VKTIESMITEAEGRMDLWQEIADDPKALKDRNKTREQALNLFEYFDGMRAGLCEALYTKDT